jgi:hypothetical protein
MREGQRSWRYVVSSAPLPPKALPPVRRFAAAAVALAGLLAHRLFDQRGCCFGFGHQTICRVMSVPVKSSPSRKPLLVSQM